MSFVKELFGIKTSYAAEISGGCMISCKEGYGEALDGYCCPTGDEPCFCKHNYGPDYDYTGKKCCHKNNECCLYGRNCSTEEPCGEECLCAEAGGVWFD